jgi:chromosome segregation ATPase
VRLLDGQKGQIFTITLATQERGKQMTDEQKYNAVLKELGELLQNKNTTISCQKWQIDQLKEKLAAAEEERDFAKEKLADASRSIDILLADIKELKGGAV